MPNDNLLIAMIRRIDLDCDARLNYLEFIDSIRPQENYMPKLKKSRQEQSVKILSPNQSNNKNQNFVRPKSSGGLRSRRKSTGNSSFIATKSRYAQATENKML
jgi:hypothetical protein